MKDWFLEHEKLREYRDVAARWWIDCKCGQRFGGQTYYGALTHFNYHRGAARNERPEQHREL